MHSVMVVDDSTTDQTMVKKALEQNYRLVQMDSGASALDFLDTAKVMPSLIILDMEMPGMNGFEFFSMIKADDRTKEIPVIFVTADPDVATEIEAYSLGAVDFIRKPYVAEILQRKVDLHISILIDKRKLRGRNATLQEFNESIQEFNVQLQEEVNATKDHVHRLEYFVIGIVTDLISKKDGHTGIHTKRVGKYLEIMLRRMQEMKLVRIGPDDMENILMASQLHDMGKIGVPDSILTKEGKYTDEEFSVMRSHTIYAADSIQKYAYLLPNSNFLSYAYQMARSHHEQWCGNGYPDRLVGPAIPQLARVLAVCDVYDALVSDRSYKKPYTHEQACQIINQGSGVQFDPQIVQVFNTCQTEFFTTSKTDI